MALDFPASPVVGQIFQSGGITWTWDGAKWSAGGAAGSPVIFVSDTAPASPLPGMLWFDSVSGQLFLWYLDPSGPGQWVPSNAPLQTTPVASGLGNVGRNILHNSGFNVNQRGLGAFTTSGYTSDRWRNEFVGGTCSTTINPITSATSVANFGDDYCKNINVAAVSGGSGVNDYAMLRQFHEDIRRIAGRTVIVSFWAWANSGTPKVCVELQQNFGTGGSPSAGAGGIGMTPITITTTPTRYSVPINVPSTSGKTFGTTAGTDFGEVNFWLSAGSPTFNTGRAGGIGVQSNTFLFWGIQCEIAQPGQTQPTALERLDIRMELHNCMRFYQSWSPPPLRGSCTSGTQTVSRMGMALPVQMRVAPTVALVSPLPVYNGVSPTTMTSVAATYVTAQSVEFDGNIGGSAWTISSACEVYLGAGGNMTFSADL